MSLPSILRSRRALLALVPLLLPCACFRESSRPAGAKDEPADNSICFECHDVYREDELTTSHAAQGVGCVDCHGSSSAHSGDLESRHAPDIPIGRAETNATCVECHEEPGLRATGREGHTALLDGTATDFRHCTDCHGEHRLAARTVRWSRETGERLDEE